MPKRNDEVLAFLSQRLSVPAKVIAAPAPDRAATEAMLAIATRVPDHGKLEPWRLLVLEREALDRIARAVVVHLRNTGKDDEAANKAAMLFSGAPLIVAVVASPVPSEKIPALEQQFSAGALCYNLLLAALASGWAATWQSGLTATDSAFLQANLGMQPQEYVAGYLVIGTAASQPVDRPRPQLDRKVEWVGA